MKPFTQGVLVGALGMFVVMGAAAAIGGPMIVEGLHLARRVIATEAAEAVETKTFPLTGLRRISVSSGVGDVTVEVGDVPDVRVTARRVARGESLSVAQAALADVRWTAQVTRRGTLLLRQEDGPKREGAEGGDVSREIHFTVVVPQKATLPVSARAGVGRVFLTGLGGVTDGEAGVGDVSARNVLGALTLEAGTGDVAIEGGKGPVAAEAGIGQVSVRGHEGRLSLKTGTGNIEAHLARITAPVELETGIGQVTMTVPRKVDARFEMSTGIGHVTSDLADVKAEEGEDETVVVLGKGTHAVKASTGTGDVRLKPAD